jgi:hypothetical protein
MDVFEYPWFYAVTFNDGLTVNVGTAQSDAQIVKLRRSGASGDVVLDLPGLLVRAGPKGTIQIFVHRNYLR